MKSFVATLLLGGTAGSHFRAGTYVITQNNNQVEVSRTQTWRRGMDGYTPQCEQSDIDNKTQASLLTEECNLDSGVTCGSFASKFTLKSVSSYIEKSYRDTGQF